MTPPLRANKDRDIAVAYDRWADTYDTMSNTTRDLAGDTLRESGLAIAGRDVLELGCGTGRNTEWIGNSARSVVAVDFSVGMLAAARARVPEPHVAFVRHDVRDKLPLMSGNLDVVIICLVLEHVEDLTPIYRETARVLRPGGDLWICELHPERQRLGMQANFIDPVTRDNVRVPAYQHTIAEFVNAGVDAGLVRKRLGEHVEPTAAPPVSPRLVSLHFGRV